MLANSRVTLWDRSQSHTASERRVRMAGCLIRSFLLFWFLGSGGNVISRYLIIFFSQTVGGERGKYHILILYYIFFGVRKYSSIRRYTYLHKALGGEHDSKHTGVSKPNSCIRIPLFSLPGESRDEEKKEFRMRTCMTSQITGPNTRLNLSKRKKNI